MSAHHCFAWTHHAAIILLSCATKTCLVLKCLHDVKVLKAFVRSSSVS